MLDAGLTGKSVIVTGAAGGIGSCVAQFFAEAGSAVMLADIAADRARALSDEMTASGWRAAAQGFDAVDPASSRHLVSATIAAFGAVDVLVNCAGLDAPRGKAWESDAEHWLRIIDVDLNGSWWSTKAVIPHMIERRSGRIIFISSIAGRRGSHSTSVAYHAAKAGVIGMTLGLAKQLEPHGILVNAVAPGSTGTGEPMTHVEIAADAAQFPLPIVGPEPVAHACLYLAGPSGDWVSGTVLNVSGGRWHG